MGSIANPNFPSNAAVTPASGIPYFTPTNNPGAAIDPKDTSTPTLFKPLKIRSVELKNRIIVAPMCMYSCEHDPNSPAVGALTDYHLVHLGHIALKGAGLVIIEATSVTPNGRISPNDSGLWQFDQGTSSEQFKGLKRIADFVHAQGSKLGIQLAHAGRKGSTAAKWLPGQYGAKMLRADASAGGFPDDVVGPTGGEAMTWSHDGTSYWPPREMTVSEIQEVISAFAQSASLAVQAGVDVIEIHAAHGYLLHQFLSPVTNHRTDSYGGSFTNRTRLLTEISQAIRFAIPSSIPLFLRISATEWLEDTSLSLSPPHDPGSWDIPSTLRLAPLLPSLGIDLLDVSSGGNHESQKIEMHSNYQIAIAGQIRSELKRQGITDLLVGAVGWITEAKAAREIVEKEEEEEVTTTAATTTRHSVEKGEEAPQQTEILADDAIKEEARAVEETVSGTRAAGGRSEPKADVVLVARQFMREPEWVMKVAKELGVKITGPCQFERAGLF